MHFGFMNVILLYNNHWPTSANRVAIFSVLSARILTYLLCAGITPYLKSHSFG